eukprot:TRINITY_DN684_c0_g1_i1.p1 TRINITY_DN684_c0_g1~~TRINITY_DN684_c0_g1_i1.p1  ORF type:complete len:158 (+),score=25.98 TRINITY_DN684_c0_g1_i1:412-885(+)
MVRDIPSHQEVYVDVDSDQSIIIELIDFAEEAKDENSAGFHFQNISEDNDAKEPKVISVHQIQNSAPQWSKYYSSVLVGESKVSKFKETALNTLITYLCCIRLKDVETDLVITLNVPTDIHPNSSSSASSTNSQADPAQLIMQVMNSLVIKDMGLFG